MLIKRISCLSLLLLLSLWRPFVTDAHAEEPTPTDPVWNPLYPTETPAPTENYDCPPEDPVGWGTVTPDPYWMIQCGHCAELNDYATSTPAPTNTPWPTPTHDGTGTPYPTGTATVTSSPLGFYTYTSTQWMQVPISPAYSQVMGYVQFEVAEPYTQLYDQLVGVHVRYYLNAGQNTGLRFGFVADNNDPFFNDHFWYWGSAPYEYAGYHDFYLSYSPRYTESGYPFPYTNEEMFKWYYLGDTAGTWPNRNQFLDIPWPAAMGVRREEELLSGIPKLYEYDCTASPYNCSVDYEVIKLLFYGTAPDVYEGGYCESVIPEGSAGDPGIELPIITVTDPTCLPIGGQTVDLSVLNLIPGVDDLGEVGIPGFQVCYQYISFGSLDLFGMTVDLDLLAFTIGAIALLRIFLRS